MRRTKSYKSYTVQITIGSNEETLCIIETSRQNAIETARRTSGTTTVVKVKRNRTSFRIFR